MPSILNHQSSIVTLLFVGRFAADKGFAQLAAAWARVREELAEARLLIVGPEAEPCNAVAREQMEALRVDPRVEFTGPREDVERCYAAADIVVLPSYREGFPNVALEAAAMELPVITTDALGCVDSVKNGETGIVVPVRDAGALAGAMIALGREAQLRARMGAAGREWVLKEFSPRVIAEGLVRLLTGQAGAVQLSATVWKPGQGG